MISLLMAFLITPISCLLLWNRMIVTVDAFIHACVLSSVLYIKFFIPLYLSMTITSFLFVLFFQYLKFYLERNEVLQIIAGVFMSITYLFIPAHMRGILFGDINSISLDMIYILCILTVILYVFIYFYYNRIVLMSLNSALDTNLNGNNNYIRFGLLFLVCLVLGSIIEYVGTVFIMPMVIIPGITARFFSTSPKTMLFIALLINIIVACVSEYIMFLYQLPVNQVILCMNFIILLMVILKKEIFYIK